MNIAEILKDYPSGTILYSPICGECKFISIDNDEYPINVQSGDKAFYSFTKEGKYIYNEECLLFPSKDNRDWNTMKPKFKKMDDLSLCFSTKIIEERFATEEEKQLFLKALDKNGYMWDEEKLEVREKQKEHQFTPFEKVLVRDCHDKNWVISLFSNINTDQEFPYVCMNAIWKHCIPYEGNEHLLGTNKKPE